MPKLDLVGLLTLTAAPNFADIELKPLQELYYKHLHPYKFIFELDNGDKVTLKFDRDKFCHLIGLQKIPDELVRIRSSGWHRNRVREYKGFRGWDNILQGTIDIAHMTRLAAGVRGGFGDARLKMLYFYYIPRLMQASSLMIRYVTPQPGSNVRCELIIFDVHDNCYLQIGMTQDQLNYGKWYYPETFLINRAASSTPNPRQVGNTTHNVVKTSKFHRYGTFQKPKSNRQRYKRPRAFRNPTLRKH